MQLELTFHYAKTDGPRNVTKVIAFILKIIAYVFKTDDNAHLRLASTGLDAGTTKQQTN